MRTSAISFGRIEFAELRRLQCVIFLMGLAFVAMVMAPCVLALTVKLRRRGFEVGSPGERRSNAQSMCTAARRLL